MTVELIPVIETGYYGHNIPSPEIFPYWEHTIIWHQYRSACFEEAGYPDKWVPYAAGSPFYRLKDISNDNLKKLVFDETSTIRSGEHSREQKSPFFGGYVLRINEEDLYFPQCCGDLSDIIYWENLGQGKAAGFYNGHPEPLINIEKTVLFLILLRGLMMNLLPYRRRKILSGLIIMLSGTQ